MARRPPAYRGPSWSWVAVEGPIDFAGLSRGSVHARALDVRVDLADTRNRTGQVRGAAVDLRGFLWPDAVERAGEKPALRAMKGADGKSLRGLIAFDTDEDEAAAAPAEVWFFPIAFADGQFNLDGLVLQPVEECGRVFRRLGTFAVEFLHVDFDLVGIETDTMTIV